MTEGAGQAGARCLAIAGLGAAALGLATLAPDAAHAQDDDEDPVASAPIRIGPVAAAPTIAITDLGIDGNVFNRPEATSDFTMAVTPATDLWLRTQDGLLGLTTRLDLVYFADLTSERSVNGFGEARYEYRFNRLRPFASFNAESTRRRYSPELDTRARHHVTNLTIGTELRALSRTSLELAVRQRRVHFADDEEFFGASLPDVLNRTLDGADLTIRHRLTPLTTVLLQASGEQERFARSPARNADSFRAHAGFELSPFALIRGRALVGYRRLAPAAGGDLPVFSGVTADVDVGYTAPTDTRVTLGVSSDVRYSYSLNYPYYLQTGWRLAITQRVVGRWDVVVFGGRDRLGYRGESPGLPGRRIDFVDHVGGGAGYYLGPDTRLGLDVASYHRRSGLPDRSYRGIRTGLSVTYAF